MSPTAHLAVINFFVGDIQGGLGPFLATWLAETDRWSPQRIGFVTTAVGLGALLLNGPAGLLVDRTGRPRLLLGLACGAILAGTVLLLFADGGFVGTLAAQSLATAGGTLVLPAVASLTLGVVGKAAFARQQGRNQAFNHAGILVAALLVFGGADLLGPGAAPIVLAGMAFGAIAATAAMPGSAWNGRRGHGWGEDEPDDDDRSSPVMAVLWNRRLALFAAALALFSLGNGAMLSLVGQRLAAADEDATGWTAVYVMVAQLTMIPVALWAGSCADTRGCRFLLLLACAALAARAVFTALVEDPAWLVAAEVLDGVASGLLGVMVPVLVADLTWGSGRTQTALGTVYAVQGVGGALSAAVGGVLVGWLGWTGAFLGLAAPAAAAFALALWLQEAEAEAAEEGEAPALPPGAAAGREQRVPTA